MNNVFSITNFFQAFIYILTHKTSLMMLFSLKNPRTVTVFKNPLPCLTHSFPPFYHPECHPIRNLVTFGVFDYVFKSKDNFCGKTRMHISKYRTDEYIRWLEEIQSYVVVAIFYFI